MVTVFSALFRAAFGKVVLGILPSPNIGPFVKEDGEVVVDTKGKGIAGSGQEPLKPLLTRTNRHAVANFSYCWVVTHLPRVVPDLPRGDYEDRGQRRQQHGAGNDAEQKTADEGSDD